MSVVEAKSCGNAAAVMVIVVVMPYLLQAVMWLVGFGVLLVVTVRIEVSMEVRTKTRIWMRTWVRI